METSLNTSTKKQIEKLFDSTTRDLCFIFNHNHIYFHSLLETGNTFNYKEDEFKPGRQLVYINKGGYKLHSIDINKLYIYAIEQYAIDDHLDKFTIHFRCKTSHSIYTLYFPKRFMTDDQNEIEAIAYEDYAWKDIITEQELNSRKEKFRWITFYNTRFTKLAKLGF